MSNSTALVKGLGVAAIVIVIFVVVALALDTAWCVEQWGIDPHVPWCVYYENSFFGKFIHP
jgi:hypothetical protein